MRAFTLVEMTMALTITAMMSVVLGGLIMAVQAAWQHSNGMGESSFQAQAATQRIKYMVSHAGVYQLPGEPTRLGLSVCTHTLVVLPLPDILVVWSGGRNGGMAEAGVQQRLPQINELVVFTLDPSDTSHFVEVMLPNDTTSIDFDDPNFNSTIVSLINSPDSQRILICDRIRQTDLKWRTARGRAGQVGNVRFEMRLTPSDDELRTFDPETDDWHQLAWAQGISASDSGMRQGTVRMELQIETRSDNSPENVSASTTIPFFGSASYRYVYRPQ